jgi:hypothetical protein
MLIFLVPVNKLIELILAVVLIITLTALLPFAYILDKIFDI